MFRKSNQELQINLFGGIPSLLEGKSKSQFDDNNSWHNQFRTQVIQRIDEMPFKPLFREKIGAPNSPVRLLIGMNILKDAMDWSDSQLFEQCRFNLLVRSSLGLFNLGDDIPVESTYYLFRKRVYEYNRQNGIDLLGITFGQVTQGQVKEFNVNGREIRMDSKLLGSNIAFFTRYEIIHQTLALFYKTLKDKYKLKLSSQDKEQLDQALKEEPQKTVYRSTKDEVKTRMQSIGILAFKLINLFTDSQNQQLQLLKRVFAEQYKVTDGQQVELRPKEEISAGSVQSPHDPDGAYRHKGDQEVKGYSMNVSETASDHTLNLITGTDVRAANTPDTAFVPKAIQSTPEVTMQPIEKIYADGAYQSPANDIPCESIDMVFTGIQGFEPRYQLEMKPDGLYVNDLQTGQIKVATLAKKLKNSKEDKWYIQTGNSRKYFDQKAIRASQLRIAMHSRPIEELRKRNNVESTIFHMGYTLHNNKTKYRGLIKNKMWAHCRSLWVNLVRIIKFLQQTCQRTLQTLKNLANPEIDNLIPLIKAILISKIDFQPVMFVFFYSLNKKYSFNKIH
jgi:hypothetical protein